MAIIEIILTLCLMMGGSKEVCLKIPVPIIVESQVVDNLSYATSTSYLGFHFKGEPYIFIDPHIVDKQAVIVHESVHYVQDYLFPDMTPCEKEAQAFEIEATFVGAQLTDEWREWYGC